MKIGAILQVIGLNDPRIRPANTTPVAMTVSNITDINLRQFDLFWKNISLIRCKAYYAQANSALFLNPGRKDLSEINDKMFYGQNFDFM